MEDAESSRQARVPCLFFVFLEEESCSTEDWQDLVSWRSPANLGLVSCILCTVSIACDCGGWQGPCLSPSRHLGAFYEERCNRDILGSWVPLRGIWPRSAVRALRWFCQAKASGCQADPDPKGFKLQDPRWSGWMCPAPYTAAWAVLTHPPHNRTHPWRERATPKAFVFRKTLTEGLKEKKMKHNIQTMRRVCTESSELCHLGNAARAPGRCKDGKEGIHSPQGRLPQAFTYLAFSFSRAFKEA